VEKLASNHVMTGPLVDDGSPPPTTSHPPTHDEPTRSASPGPPCCNRRRPLVRADTRATADGRDRAGGRPV